VEGKVFLVLFELVSNFLINFFRGLDNYLSVKQVTQYISDEPWGWYQSPSKLWQVSKSWDGI